MAYTQDGRRLVVKTPLGKDDLLLLAKIADLAHSWVYRNLQNERREQSF